MVAVLRELCGSHVCYCCGHRHSVAVCICVFTFVITAYVMMWHVTIIAAACIIAATAAQVFTKNRP